MSSKVRAVIVGCGNISKLWLESAGEIENLEVMGFVDINEEAAKMRQSEFGSEGSQVGSDLEKMLDKLRPDVVFDCTIPESHANVVLTALDHGCHILGEKPLADNMENARRMVDAATRADKTYAVVQNRRYDCHIRAFKDMVQSGRIGRLTTLHSDFYIGAHFEGFRNTMEHVLLLDMAIHTFDAARFISGENPVAVYCKEWNPTGSWYDHDASAVCIFEMSNGVVYTYRGSWCSEGLNTTWEGDWRAMGEKGSVTWDGGKRFGGEVVAKTGSFFSELNKLEIDIQPDVVHAGHAGVIREFVDCIVDNRTPETICTDNINSLAMVFGAIESAETGKRVEIVY